MKLSREQERRFIKQAQNGDFEALERLLVHMEPNITAVARKLIGRNSVQVDDLIQEGRIGLIDAIKRFDLDSSHGLSAYANWYIKGPMVSFCKTNADAISLNIPVDGQDGPEIIDTLEDQVSLSPEAQVILKEEGDEKLSPEAQAQVALVARAMESLSPRERCIVRWHYLQTGEGTPIKRLAEVYDISESCVRQIADEAKKKIKVFVQIERGELKPEDVIREVSQAGEERTVQQDAAESIDSLLRIGLVPTAGQAIKVLHALGEQKKRTALLEAHGQHRENVGVTEEAKEVAGDFPLPRIPEVGKGEMPPTEEVTAVLLARANTLQIMDDVLAVALLATDDSQVTKWLKGVRKRASTPDLDEERLDK